MDTTENGSQNVPEVQIALVRPTEEEIKRQKNREYGHRYRLLHRDKYRQLGREGSRRYRERHPGRQREANRQYRERHPERSRESHRRASRKSYYAHLEKNRQYARRYYHAHTEKRIVYQKELYLKQRDEILTKRKKTAEKLRDAIWDIYGGPICKCCGETEKRFLSLDHADNNGADHRRREKIGSGFALYYWLKRKGYPPGFQVLCMQCNFAKGKCRGICPHKEIKSPIDTFLEFL